MDCAVPLTRSISLNCEFPSGSIFRAFASVPIVGARNGGKPASAFWADRAATRFRATAISPGDHRTRHRQSADCAGGRGRRGSASPCGRTGHRSDGLPPCSKPRTDYTRCWREKPLRSDGSGLRRLNWRRGFGATVAACGERAFLASKTGIYAYFSSETEALTSDLNIYW